MNIFNRIVVVLLLLFLIVLSIVSVVNIFANLFKWSEVADRILNSMTNVNVYIAALIMILLLIVSIVLIVFELYRRKVKTAPILAVKSGSAMIDLRSASNQIKDEISGVKDISDVKVNIIPKSDGVIVNVYSKLTKGLNVTGKMQEVVDRTTKFATENLGFKIIKTNFTAIGFAPENIKNAGKFENMPEEKVTKRNDKKEVPTLSATGATYEADRAEPVAEKKAMEQSTIKEDGPEPDIEIKPLTETAAAHIPEIDDAPDPEIKKENETGPHTYEY